MAGVQLTYPPFQSGGDASKQASRQTKEGHQCSVMSHGTSISSMTQALSIQERTPTGFPRDTGTASSHRCHDWLRPLSRCPAPERTVLVCTQDPGLGETIKTCVSGTNSRGRDSIDSRQPMGTWRLAISTDLFSSLASRNRACHFRTSNT